MEDESPFDILELKTEPRPRPPTQLSKHLVLERRPQLLRAGRRRAKNSFSSVTFALEEYWAKSAQLFTFYWALTRNKIQFSTKLLCDKVSVIYLNIGLTPSWNLEEIDSAIIWSTGQAWRNWMKIMDGSQAPRSGSIRHITYVRVGDNRALLRN